MRANGGGSSADCPPDLNGTATGLHVEDARMSAAAAGSKVSGDSEVWGHLPATASSLYRQQAGQEPVAVPMWRGPDSFQDIHFFNYTGTLGEGRVTFTTYDENGNVVAERTAGQ